jgi:OmcA/MtrC family decaheme c-type cytochrome
VTAPDATHLAHTGGRQDNDAACKDCHVVARTGGPRLYAPLNQAHRPLNSRAPNASPRWSRVTGTIVSVQNMKPGQLPTVKFRVDDRNGAITPLDHPTTPMDLVVPTSPVPRRMTGLSLVLSGPASEYSTGGGTVMRAPLVTRRSAAPTAPATEWWDLASGFTPSADAAGEFTYTFTTPLPSTATGTWAIAIEGRRRPDGTSAAAAPDYVGSLPAYDTATDTFNWPYTGEAISEHLTNDVKYVDVATGALTTDPARARRTVVDQAKCERCHLELNLHGANRHDVAHCLLCHTPDATDWAVRPRDTRTFLDDGVDGNGMVLLSDPIDPTLAGATKRWGYATVDGIEERSIHLKTMVHRIHVGERKGAASLEGIRPFAVYGRSSTPRSPPSVIFFDDVRFPGDLANCEVCHLPGTWTLEAIPASAAATTANERGNLVHTGTSAAPARSAHTSTSELKRQPATAACLSCHTSGAAVSHAADKTPGGVEQCPTCHGERGADSVRKWHGVP